MKIAFFYPSSSVRLPINPSSIFTDPRGLTGSEGSFFHYAFGMANEFDVTIFSKFTHVDKVFGAHCVHYEEWESTYRHQNWDVLISWMIPEPLKYANKNTFRIYNQQCSDFSCCEPGWENYVDVFLPLSNSHANYMVSQTSFPKSKYRILHNGVDTSQFNPSIAEKIPGKMIWASSHDRGLHWLLEAYPKIKAKAPDANLHVFYDFNGVEVFSKWENITPYNDERSRRCNELGQRSRYIKEAIKRLSSMGVNIHKSVSRERIKHEMASSVCLPYPLDPIHYTETFGVTVLEAMACAAVPVLCAQDCFRELWSSDCPSVPAPYYDHKDDFIDKTISVLNNKDFFNHWKDKCVKHAGKFDWKKLLPKFSSFIRTRGDHGLPDVDWNIKLYNLFHC